MMAKKDRFPSGYSASVAPHYESEGSGSLDHIEDSSAPTRKWIDLNSASKYGFAVPVHTIPLSKLSSSEAKNLVLRLGSELEQVQFLLNKVELQKKKPVNAVTLSSSNGIHSWSNAQPKKSSGLGYGPGKKGRGWNRSTSGKFQAGGQNKLVNANAGLLKQCESLLKKLISQQYGWVFNTPVDVVKLNIPDYFDVIKNPMDLGTIKRKLTSGQYSSPLEFLADVRLTFANAKTYNPPGTDVHIMADTMSQFFELRWKAVEKKLVVDTSQSLPKRSEISDEPEIALPVHPSKKRKLSPALHEKVQEPVKRMMGDEEKHKLSYDLENFVGEMPDSIVNILREQSSSKGDGEEDEIELDINALSDDTLFTLRKLLDDHFQEKHKDLTRSEACEIELPNVSGLSNSSLQVDKGNDLLDEDVDIGGNEAPVTSYPPVVIDKDAGGRAEEYIEAGPDSDGGSEGSKGSSAVKQVQDDVDERADSDRKAEDEELVGGHLIGQDERQLSPDKQYRAAILKNRFLDTILKAREKTLQDDKMDPEKLRREREELEMHKRRDKARLQAEAKAAEDARKQAEAEAAAEAKRRREIEREAAREALLKMEKTVEINESSKFLEDLEKLRVAANEPLPSSVDETSPDYSHDGFGNFEFGGSNPLEQLGLYMKDDEEDEEGEPPSVPNVTTDDAEEGEID